MDLAAIFLASAVAFTSATEVSHIIPGLETAEVISTGCEGGLSSLCLSSIDGAWWGVAIEVLAVVISFWALSIVCDDYLAVTLETICYRFELPNEVAGASLMVPPPQKL